MTNATTKLTKRDYFNQLLALAETEEQRNFINHELQLLANKAEKSKSAERKPSKETLARQATMAQAIDELPTVASTIEDLLASVPSFKSLTKGQVSSIMGDYVKAGKVRRTLIKKKVHYEVVA